MQFSIEKYHFRSEKFNSNPPAGGNGNDKSESEPENKETLMLETIIIRFCKAYGFSRPRMYRRQARKNYLALAKTKKRSTKKNSHIGTLIF